MHRKAIAHPHGQQRIGTTINAEIMLRFEWQSGIESISHQSHEVFSEACVAVLAKKRGSQPPERRVEASAFFRWHFAVCCGIR